MASLDDNPNSLSTASASALSCASTRARIVSVFGIVLLLGRNVARLGNKVNLGTTGRGTPGMADRTAGLSPSRGRVGAHPVRPGPVGGHAPRDGEGHTRHPTDRKSTRLNSSHI